MDFFANAGRKMSNIIDVAFKILLTICGLAALAVLIAAISVQMDGGFGAFLVVLICGVLAVGVILGLGYLMFLQLAAFAELVENSNRILEQMKKEEPRKKPIMRTEEKPKQRPIVRSEDGPRTVTGNPEGARKVIACPKCGKSQFDGNRQCFACGAPLKTEE